MDVKPNQIKPMQCNVDASLVSRTPLRRHIMETRSRLLAEYSCTTRQQQQRTFQ